MQIHFSFRSRNLGISNSEAERLLQDLQRLIVPALLIMQLLLTGCSTRVDVSTEHSNGAESSAAHTNVEVDFLADQSTGSDPTPTQEELPVAAECDSKEVEVFEITEITVIVDSPTVNIHRHQHEHLHIENSQEPRRRKTKPERIAVEVIPQRIDPRCERLRREYEERVEKLQELFAK